MWTTLLIGAALGACWAYGAISERCELQTKEDWKADHELRMAVCMRVFRLEAENARLRLFIAAGEMPEGGKKIARMAIAALGTVASTESQALPNDEPSPA